MAPLPSPQPANPLSCVVCRSALNPGAEKCTECGSFQGEPCVICAQRLPNTASSPRKCTQCDSYQSRLQRAMSFSNSTLALLTALFAVGGLILPGVHAFLVPASVAVLGTTEDRELLVQVTNRTDADLYLAKAELSGDLLPEGPYALNPVGDEGGYLDRDEKPIPPGPHTIRLRPTRTLSLTGPPAPRTPFTLDLAVQPGRRWSGKVLQVHGLEDFMCKWGDLDPCRPPETEASTKGAES